MRDAGKTPDWREVKEGLPGSHPGGISLTKRLFASAGLRPPAAVLDLGAGAGESVEYLDGLGFCAVGIDLNGTAGKNQNLFHGCPGKTERTGPGRTESIYPGRMERVCSRQTKAGEKEAGVRAPGELCGCGGRVVRQDMTRLEFSDESFDVCLAECSISVCGDGEAALAQAWRVLRPGGSFLVSDVFFGKEDAPSMSMREPLTRDCWERAFGRAGFEIADIRDETALWKEFFLERLWSGDADESCLAFFRAAGRAKCGYFAACLRKAPAHARQFPWDVFRNV